MKRLLACSLVTLISGCATEHPPHSLSLAREVIEKPRIIQAPQNNFELRYGQDVSLESAFNQYTKTGKAADIITDGFVKFAYNNGQQPIIKTTPFQETVISLEPGEKFTNISSGDPNRWSYSVAVSGSDGKLQQNVLIKPSLPDIGTNMVITTNKRIYNVRLLSSMNDRFTKSVSFWYPNDMVTAMNDVAIKAVDAKPVGNIALDSLHNLNFNYTYSCGRFCETPSWAPTRVFDDGLHTYIQLPKKTASRDMPALFILDNKVKELVNYRSHPPYLVVDNIFKEAILILGVGRAQKKLTLTNHHYS